jgi:uncharacterized protein YqiB (DUF1249 family)
MLSIALSPEMVTASGQLKNFSGGYKQSNKKKKQKNKKKQNNSGIAILTRNCRKHCTMTYAYT